MKEITEIKEIHNILYETLCYFDDFCRENNIRYFLSNGTLLGAAKYGDFIPWDDDIDVMLLREDYNKLVSLTTVNNEKYRLLCKEQITEWRMPYAKLSREDTVIKEGDYNFGVPFGISIDIFPIDNWSSCLGIAKIQAIKSECLKRLLICSIGGDFFTLKTGMKRLILKMMWFTGKKIGYERLQKSLLKSAKKPLTPTSKYIGCRAWTCHLDREVFPKEFFFKTAELEFGNRKFPVIERYEDYLYSLYGNWKAELPADKQHSNHEIRAWNKDAE